MTATLFPRLSRLHVEQILDAPDKERDKITEAIGKAPQYAATGGSRISADALKKLRKQLTQIATDCGYPQTATMEDRRKFDHEVAVYLASHPDFSSPELYRDDVWAYLTTVLVPKLVRWRFKTDRRERFHGGVRNMLQRLWQRAVALDRGEDHPARWTLIIALSEDAFTQLMERASISNDARLVRGIAETWLKHSKAGSTSNMESLTRRALISLRRKNQVQMLTALPDNTLADVIDAAFNTAKVTEQKQRNAA